MGLWRAQAEGKVDGSTDLHVFQRVLLGYTPQYVFFTALLHLAGE